jgi:hypothetical protein
MLAIIAGSFALTLPTLTHFYEKKKIRREFTMRIRAWAITTSVDVCAVLNSETPLNYYNLETFSKKKLSFLRTNFYWSLSDDHAYLANSIDNKISYAVSLMERLQQEEKPEIKISLLSLALGSYCSALIDADHFMAGSLDNYLQILDFDKISDLNVIMERNRSPVRQFLKQDIRAN